MELLLIGLKETGGEDKRWMELTEYRLRWRVLLIAVLNHWILLLESELCGSYQTGFSIQLPEGESLVESHRSRA
jgi:hypothetical protein